MSVTEQQAVELFNNAKLAPSAVQKDTYLSQVLELVVRKEPELIPAFLPEICELQMDPTPGVRKFVGAFLAESVQLTERSDLLATAAACLETLAADGNANVVKQAITAAHAVLRRALGVAAAQPRDAAAAACCTAARHMQEAICAIGLRHANDGVKLTTIKFMETVVLVYTAEHAPQLPGFQHAVFKLPDPAGLAQEADKQLRQLEEQLRQQNVTLLAGPVAIVLLKSVATIAVERPNCLGKLLPSLLQLATKGVFKAPAPATSVASTSASDGHVANGVDASIGNALRTALVMLLKSRSDHVRPWRARVEEALRAMGAEAAVAQAAKALARQSVKEARAKVKLEEDALNGSIGPDNGAAKRARLDPATAAGTPTGAALAAAPTPPPAAADPAGGEHPPTTPEQLHKLQEVLAALLDSGQTAVANTVIDRLTPAVLADLVMELMQFLSPTAAQPPTGGTATMAPVRAPTPPPTGVPSPAPPPPLYRPQAVRPAGLGGPRPPPGPPPPGLGQPKAQSALDDQDLLASLFEGEPNEPSANGRAATPSPAPFTTPPVPPAPPPASRLATGTFQDRSDADRSTTAERAPTLPIVSGGTTTAQPPFRTTAVAGQQPPSTTAARRATPPPQFAAAAPRVIAPPPPPTGPPRPSPLPVTLSAAQYKALQHGAVRRIFAARAASVHGFRELLLSRLATKSPAEDGLQDLVLEHLLANYQARQGHDLALRWLYSLFITHSRVPSASSGAAAAAATPAAAAGDAMEIDEDKAKDDEDKATGDDVTLAEQKEAVIAALEAEAAAAVAATAAAATAKEQDDAAAARSAQEQGSGPMDTDGAEAEPGKAAEMGGDGGQQETGDVPLVPVQEAGGAVDLSGTPYQDVLLALLEGLRERRPANDGAISQLLLQAPALPLPATTDLLRDILSQGGDWSTLMLSAARALIEQRPPVRFPMLQLVLDAAVAEDPDTRSKAVRLLANKLYGQPHLELEIEEFATGMLLQLVETEGPAPPLAPADEATPARADGTTPPTAAPTAPATATPVPATAADAPDFDAQKDRGERQCSLYMALCLHKHSLLRRLMEVYGRATPPVQAAVHIQAPALAQAIGADSDVLLELIPRHPAGATRLVLQMVNVLTEQRHPTPRLVAACTALYESSQDPQAIAPVAVAMPKEAVAKLLPRLLELQSGALRQLYKRLAGGGAAGSAAAGLPPLFAPSEILVLLHEVDPKRDRVHTKRLIAAIDTALHSPETFPQQTVAQAIQSMDSRTPLPQLFMRTVIQALQTAPKLLKFVMDLLTKLIGRQVWADPQQWQGFVLCCERHVPHSYPILLQLPPNVLDTALAKFKPAVWDGLARYATGGNSTVPVFAGVRAVLDKYKAKAEAGTAAAAAAAATQQQQAERPGSANQPAAAAAVGGASTGGAAAAVKKEESGNGGSATISSIKSEPSGELRRRTAGGTAASGGPQPKAEAPTTAAVRAGAAAAAAAAAASVAAARPDHKGEEEGWDVDAWLD